MQSAESVTSIFEGRAALFLAVGFLEFHQVTAADVAAVRTGEEAAQQVEGEGVAVHFAAGGEEFGVVGLDFRGAGPVGVGVMEQRGAGFFGEIAEVHAEHAAPCGVGVALEIGEIGERFARDDEAEAIKRGRRNGERGILRRGLVGELVEDAVLRRLGEVRERLGVVRSLRGVQPVVGLPVALFADAREDGQLVASLPITEIVAAFVRTRLDSV